MLVIGYRSLGSVKTDYSWLLAWSYGCDVVIHQFYFHLLIKQG